MCDVNRFDFSRIYGTISKWRPVLDGMFLPPSAINHKHGSTLMWFVTEIYNKRVCSVLREPRALENRKEGTPPKTCMHFIFLFESLTFSLVLYFCVGFFFLKMLLCMFLFGFTQPVDQQQHPSDACGPVHQTHQEKKLHSG